MATVSVSNFLNFHIKAVMSRRIWQGAILMYSTVGVFFLEALANWVQGMGYGTDGADLTFGDMNDEEEAFQFEGVEFEIGFDDPPNILRVDEATFYRWLRMACERYVK